MQLSIIIPTFNEAHNIYRLLNFIHKTNLHKPLYEIIIIDGTSTDNTVKIAKTFDVKILHSKIRNRAHQLNLGGKAAKGKILYFLHADCLPPVEFINLIVNHIDTGYSSGSFRLKFDHQHWFLMLNAWFTQFNYYRFRFGDQSFFITNQLYQKLNGYDEGYYLLEDQDIVKRAIKKKGYVLEPTPILVSSRAYLKYGVIKLQFYYYIIYILYAIGTKQIKLQKLYIKLISN